MSEMIPGDPIVVLKNPESSLSAILRACDEIERDAAVFPEVVVGISSNVTIEMLGIYLRRHALLNGKKARIVSGNYDDPVGDVEAFLAARVNIAVILPFFDNLLPSFEAQVGVLPDETIEGKMEETRRKYRLVFERTERIPRVFLCTFHRFSPSTSETSEDLHRWITRFNEALRDEASGFENVRCIDMADIVGSVGTRIAFDPRFYFKAKAPFTTPILDEIARRISSRTRGFQSHFFKALVLDCDGTLWGGVLGEDLISGIKLNAHDYPGNVFWRVQHELVRLERNGVLLCLCSKNNPEDVDEVLSRHPGSVLKDENLVLKKINWLDKVDNLKAISLELNISLDSIVFLDDSSFECESVRIRLPMVRTVQVPANLSEYPKAIEGIKDLFLAAGVSEESRSKTMQYKQRASAEETKIGFESKEEYLASLGLKVTIFRNDLANTSRISELTMKTNQFNLTTRRYGESEIAELMRDPAATVYSFSVEDKFGDAGIVGVAIVSWTETARVLLFLMSCRVLGRGIEDAFWGAFVGEVSGRGFQRISAAYVPTKKNAQVSDLYDRLGLSLINEGPDGTRGYESRINEIRVSKPAWIEVINAR